MNLRFKLMTAFVTLIIIPLLLLGTLTFWIAFQMLEEKYNQQAELSLKATGKSVSYLFSEMDRVTDLGIGSSVFEGALSARNPREQNLAKADYLQLNANQRNFRMLLYNHPSINFAYLYNTRSDSNWQQVVPIFDKQGFKALPFEQFEQHEIYENVLKRRGAPLWIGPNEYPEITGNEDGFTQIRVIKSMSSLRNLGVLVVQVKNWELDSIFNKFQWDNPNSPLFYLVNRNGNILYESDNEHKLSNLQSVIEPVANSTSLYNSYKTDFNGQESLISTYKLKDFDWYIVSVTSWKMLTKEMVDFGIWVAIIMFACVVAALLFFLLFMNRITNSVNRIVRFMRRVETGELNVRVEEKGNDEMTALAKGFNQLTERVSGLIDQVKQEQKQKNMAEMRVLEAQIKPHFIFNTLESINALAIQNEGRKVSQMVYRLGNILRTSIQDKEEITIREELAYLRSYLEIQKFRFEDLFNFEIDVPDDILNNQILKLTLQPLVENCIQHGFDGITHTGWIRITAYDDAERIFIDVEDNGLGMSNEQLKKFQYMQSDEQKALLPIVDQTYNTERRGLGVRSVADRIRITYGLRYGLFICSAPSKGTIIRCIIPKYEQGEAE